MHIRQIHARLKMRSYAAEVFWAVLPRKSFLKLKARSRAPEFAYIHAQACKHLHYIYITSFSRRFYPKRLTYVQLTMNTHFTFTLMAHCTSGAIRGSVSCSRTFRQGILLATFRLEEHTSELQ